MIWAKAVLFLLLACGCSQQRSKRVIKGEVLQGRPTNYKAIRYYAALATVHAIPWYTFGFWNFLKKWGVYGTWKCSGVLLAPMLVQTACHCVADFDVDSARSPLPPKVENHWEYSGVVYVGISHRFGEESMVTYSPIKTERFMIHSKCGQMGINDHITYDYALIRIDITWLKADKNPYPWIEIERAPQYTANQILDFHHYALQREMVCLHIGFGAYDFDDLVTMSDDLRHGWGMLLPHLTCVVKTTRPGNRKKVVEYVSWVCAMKFPFHDQDPGPGDSGGPVTCGGRFYALVSDGQSTQRGSNIETIALHSALVHNLHANAIEYRFELIHYDPEGYKPKGRHNVAKKLVDIQEKNTYSSTSTGNVATSGIPLIACLFPLMYIFTPECIIGERRKYNSFREI